jgi:hypothetical protein
LILHELYEKCLYLEDNIVYMERFIQELAEKFAPTYMASRKEKCYLVELESTERPRVSRAYPAWNPLVYFSAIPLDPEGYSAYEINYLTIWDWDQGIDGHRWDTERTAVLVIGPQEKSTDTDDYYAEEAYYAAHEGAITDRSQFCACPVEDCGVTVYWTQGKHASYADLHEKWWLETFVNPAYTSKPGTYTLKDVGTPENPQYPWVTYNHKWGPNVDSIYSKLKKRVWTRKNLQKIERNRHYSEEEIEQFQEYENIPPTGHLDEKTLLASKNLDSHLMKHFDDFTKEEFVSLKDADISGREIEKIAKSRVRGKELKRYVGSHIDKK